MAQLAIKGHETRGKEVIELLAMLGGNNAFGHFGNNTAGVYYVDKSYKNHITCSGINKNNLIIFTLEEFLEKFPYKVGDKVQHKGATSCGTVYVIKHMKWVNNHIEYDIRPLYDYNHIGLVTLCADDLQPFKEETMEERKYADLRIDVDQDDKLATEVTIDGNKITPPENYLIGKITKVDNGMLVEFVKKQPKYPKTYAECCEVLNIAYPYFDAVDNYISASTYKNELFGKLKKLIIYRDAYWKIAGEQMGLGKPWEPDYKNPDIDLYVIINIYNQVEKAKYGYSFQHCILSFPTEEMRDTFYENFKDLIESCKEFL